LVGAAALALAISRSPASAFSRSCLAREGENDALMRKALLSALTADPLPADNEAPTLVRGLANMAHMHAEMLKNHCDEGDQASVHRSLSLSELRKAIDELSSNR
jgi:hypothetical protein